MAWPKGYPRSDEWKAKIAAALRGRRKTASACARMSAAKKGRTVRAFTPDDYAKSLATRRGRKLTDAHRQKLSERKAERVPCYTKRTVVYGVHKFRSSYELRTARAFDALGLSWQYEARVFRVTPTQSYRPDFMVPDTGAIWEVKGYIDEKSRKKMAAFRRRYPDMPLVVATLPVIEMLERAAGAQKAS